MEKGFALYYVLVLYIIHFLFNFLRLQDFFSSTHIGCPIDDKEANNAIIFGYVVSWFLGEFSFQAGTEV